MAEEQSGTNAVELATELTIAWLSNPNTRTQAEEVPDFLRKMHDAVTELSTGARSGEMSSEQETHKPAVTVRKSLSSKDHIISLIDGKPYKTLKRHLANNGLTPAQYRERFGLKPDYPMVAPAYAETRRNLAKAIGLGRKPRQSSTTAAPKATPDAPKVAPKRRRKSAEAK
jgi:predicted transcriptional regulator